MKPEELAARLSANAVRQLRVRVLSRAIITAQGEVIPRAPVKTGTGRRSITHYVDPDGKYATLGTNLDYLRFVHEGTGIYGPKRRPIKPTTKQALKFKIGSRTFFRRSVKGMKARPFFKEGLAAARPRIEQEIAEAGEGWLVEVVKK